MKKFVRNILIIMAVFLLTGCTAKYDLYINKDNTITEVISGKVTNKELDNGNASDVNSYLYALEEATPLIDNEGSYEKEVIDKKNHKEFTYKYTYNTNFSKSSILQKCFENIDYQETEDTYEFKLSGKFFCLLPKKIEVNLISDYGVIENNADKANGNKYTWIIKNSDNVDISAKISKNVLYKKDEGVDILKIIEIAGSIIFLILLIAMLIIYKKKNDEK